MTTYMALDILKAMNRRCCTTTLPYSHIRLIASLLKRCTTRKGYVASPTGSSVTLESVYAGHKIAKYLGLSDPSGVPAFVDSLQNANGGFRRSSFGGISSLEYSYLALSIISDIGGPSKSCCSPVQFWNRGV